MLHRVLGQGVGGRMLPSPGHNKLWIRNQQLQQQYGILSRLMVGIGTQSPLETSLRTAHRGSTQRSGF